MSQLTPEMLDTGKMKDVQAAMGKDLRVAAKTLKGKNAWFVAAADVPLPDKTKIPLFVVLRLEAEAKAWELKLKAKKPPALAAGTCKLHTKDGIAVQVALETVKGDRAKALKAARLAFKMDKKVMVADPLAKGGDAEPGSADDSPDNAATAPGSATAAKQQLEKIAPGVGAMVDESPVDNAAVLEILKEFAGQGLTKDQLANALKRTFA